RRWAGRATASVRIAGVPRAAVGARQALDAGRGRTVVLAVGCPPTARHAVRTTSGVGLAHLAAAPIALLVASARHAACSTVRVARAGLTSTGNAALAAAALGVGQTLHAGEASLIAVLTGALAVVTSRSAVSVRV